MNRAGIVLTLAAAALWSQSARPAFDAFEVAAIKPSDPETRGRWIRMQSANQVAARNHTLKTLIAAAYNISPVTISGGASWVESDHYDILARTPGAVRPNLEEQMAMLRRLLADRFQLAFHRERKTLAYYSLSVGKGGPKLKATTVSPDANPEGPPLLAFVLAPGKVTLPARYTTMSEFASVLQRAAFEHPVVDETGLTGRYDFDLAFTPDETLFGGVLTETPESTEPRLFKAIEQQLGLSLKATRGPVATLVIDRAERPSEN
jgi:uncharacterized protein (TIGR03435 family)